MFVMKLEDFATLPLNKNEINLMKGLIPQLCWGEWSKQERVGYQEKASHAKMRMVSQAKLKN